ncbi:hypothetical protein DL771_006689 [Monosporascus sp. 5C6A]|nr:hypothetical protein DL771_006689 [Monosporascus sp. 5C6A]
MQCHERTGCVSVAFSTRVPKEVTLANLEASETPLEANLDTVVVITAKPRSRIKKTVSICECTALARSYLHRKSKQTPDADAPARAVSPMPATLSPLQPCEQETPMLLVNADRDRTTRTPRPLSGLGSLEIRAAQRTFEGAYMRTALSQFSFALVVLRIFNSEFYAIGALFAAYGVAVMFCAVYRRYQGNRQFFSAADGDGGTVKKFRTSGNSVFLLASEPPFEDGEEGRRAGLRETHEVIVRFLPRIGAFPSEWQAEGVFGKRATYKAISRTERPSAAFRFGVAQEPLWRSGAALS